jgi:hypothetical protein
VTPLALEEREALHTIQLLFGKPLRHVRGLFESIAINAVISYLKQEDIVIPYIGALKVSYVGDKISGKGREARIKCELTPSAFLTRNIGQAEDGEETDAERILLNRIKGIFKSRLEESA